MTPNDEERQGLLSLDFSQQQCLGGVGCATEAGEAFSLFLCRLG